jgi:hypothetical protein
MPQYTADEALNQIVGILEGVIQDYADRQQQS